MRPIKLEVRYLYNEEVRSTWSMVPALVMFTLMVSSPLLTALGIVREKETGSIYNIYSSTVTRFEFLAGKLLPYVADFLGECRGAVVHGHSVVRRAI